MKRFILFACDTHYPCGGWDDFAGFYDSVEEAETAWHALLIDHYHIIDQEIFEVVRRGSYKDFP